MSEASLWMLITALGAVGTALFGYAAYRLHRMMGGFVPRQLRWAYPPRGGDSDAADAVLLARFRLVLFFALTMLWLALLAVSHNVAPWPWLLYAMMACPPPRGWPPWPKTCSCPRARRRPGCLAKSSGA